jgi:energy-coupling factor transporter ATP-binding protein EcfA2
VELGRLEGWDPLPLSVRDARRYAVPLRDRLASGPVPLPRRGLVNADSCLALRARNVVVRHASVVAVANVNLDLDRGQVTALMGRNGSGKSSLLWALQGTGPRQAGTVDVDGQDPKGMAPSRARRLVTLVPHTPADLVYQDSVSAECAQADKESGSSPQSGARSLLDRLSPGIPGDVHPRDLSEGQRLALVLALQLSAGPQVVLLDEPTRGLDYGAKRSLIGIVDQMAHEGRAVVIATHDVEFVASAADRVVVLAEGDIVADGPTSEVIGASPAFAPQVAKVLAPLEYLTVAQVRQAVVEAG